MASAATSKIRMGISKSAHSSKLQRAQHIAGYTRIELDTELIKLIYVFQEKYILKTLQIVHITRKVFMSIYPNEASYIAELESKIKQLEKKAEFDSPLSAA